MNFSARPEPVEGRPREVREEARWPLWLIGAEIALALGVCAVASVLCIADERVEVPCLGWLGPLISRIVLWGSPLVPWGIPPSAVPLLCLAAVCAYLAVAWRERRRSRESASSRSKARGWPLSLEAGLLALLTLLTVVYRFYALNRIPADSVGDVAFSLLSASDWHSLFDVNVFGGAPLGLVHHLLLAALWRLFGATVLTLRFASALTSVLLAQALYGLTRRLAGPLAAVIATALYVASPVEMVWGRHDMFPFSASPLVILLALSTHLALTRFSLRYWVATALLMGATYHLFPSGLTAFLIPFGAVAWTALFDRERLRRCGWRIALLPVGLGLWLAGRSFATALATGTWEWLGPFDPRLSSRVARGEGWQEAWTGFAENLGQIVTQIYVGWPGDVHQTPISLFGVPRTWVTPLLAILFTAGLARCFVRRSDPASAVLLSLLAAGAVPGIVSIAAAHRMSVVFPAMTVIAAIAAAAGLDWLERRWGAAGRWAKVALSWIVLSASFLTMGSVYFSQRNAEPPSVTLAKSLRPYLEPGTLMVLDLPLGLQIDVNFLLFDDTLRDRSAIVWSAPDRWPRLVAHPQPDWNDSYYRLTALRHQIPELRRRQWKRVVYVVHDAPESDARIDVLRSAFENARVTRVAPRTWRPGYGFTAVEVERAEAGALSAPTL